MFVFNEGVPRAGKSYDAVKYHILPALKRKRHVWARLNGLDHAAIAAYLKMPEDLIRDLLHLVESKDVVSTFVAVQNPDTGQWGIADEFKNSLIVIDEVHEFYVSERKPLNPAVENFFALLGQNGGDGVIMTQWIQRVHQAIKARIEKKNSFQKLSAVGMEGKYQVTYYQTVAAGKFQKIGSATKTYDPDIYPLYHGYAPGADNTEVYKEGGTNVWKAMAFRGAIFGVIGIVAVWGLYSFFSGGGEGFVTGDKAKLIDASAQPAAMQQQVTTATAAAPPPVDNLKPEQRYVVDLANRGRVRLAAFGFFGDKPIGVVEWVDASGVTIESLTLAALFDAGFRVNPMKYGYKLTVQDHTIIATHWPREQPRREQDASLYQLDKAGADGSAFASVASEGGASAPSQGTLISGDMRSIVGGEPAH